MPDTALKPYLVVADDDRTRRDGVIEELRSRYAGDYELDACPADELTHRLEELRSAGATVAVVLATCEGSAELLAGVRRLFPTARRALLIPWLGWANPETAELVLRAMARGWIDLYVLQPGRRPDEIFHRTITELLQESARLRGDGPAGATVVADTRSVRAHELRSTLSGLGIPHRVRPADDGAPPAVTLADGSVLVDPSPAELARALGFPTEVESHRADVVVVGAGPAGLGAAVYAASEGLRTTVIDSGAVGGQAGSSSLIRNYLGFPRGLGGGELAQRAYQQAWLFGTRFRLTERVVSLEPQEEGLVVRCADGVEVTARAVVLALGVEYRRLEVPGLVELEGAGVYYGAAISEARAVEGEEVYLVGGGNSAGQAALHLARYARHVTILVRGETLASSMSQYLIEALGETANIDVRFRTSVVAGGGEGRLESLELERDGARETVPAAALFVLIGARPLTEWLPETIERDEWGYVVTGPNKETTMPGVFAAGDVTSRSVKRVASAVGAGALAISGVHAYLAEEGMTRPAHS